MQSIDQINRALLLAAASPHSGAGIHALPDPSLDLHMDAKTIKIASGLLRRVQKTESHHYRNASMMNKQGHNGLSCRETKGRYSRHADFYHILTCSLAAGGVLSKLEQIVLTTSDERRPEGVTLSPYTHS